MSQPVHAIVLHRFAASAEQVFAAWFDPVWLGRWMFGSVVHDERIVQLTLDARVGGRFSFVVEREGEEINYVGDYLELDRPRLLVFTWGRREDLPDTSRVIVELAPRDEGCELKLTHLMGAQWSAHADEVAGIWTKLLDALEQAIRQEGGATAAETFP